MTMLDAIGPYEVLRCLQDVNIKFVAKQKGEIKADSHFVHLNAKYSIDEIDRADILLVPGSTVAFLREMKDQKILDWIKKIDQTTQKTVSVCSGSLILAATGLLAGKKATTHWQAMKLLSKYEVTPTAERMIEEGKYITAAGVSAGIDMAIYLINQLKGETAAKAAQLVIEYDPQPMFDSGNFSTADEEVITLAKKIMEKDAKKDLSLLDMLKHLRSLWKLSK